MNMVRAIVKPGTFLSLTAAAVLVLLSPDPASACRATIGDRVWLDTNGNGIQDVGEPGIPDVLVTLSDINGNVLLTTHTDANGYYIFSNETTGKRMPPTCETAYIVRAETPAGLTPTILLVGDPATDSNDPSWTAVTPSDQDDFDTRASDLTIDFGFVSPCSGAIGDFVWNDLNNNGVQDAGELGIAGVVVTMGPNRVTETSASGFYQFTGVCAGTYPVCAAVPVGFQPSPPDAGANDALDSDGVSNNTGLSCTNVTLLSGAADNPTIDFGFWKMLITGPGTGTPGYWKNHPEAWPVGSITIGGVTYSRDAAIFLMGLPDGDKTYTVFRALVAAKLNVLIGNDSTCILSTISAADDWMADYGPVGSEVRASSLAWTLGEPLYGRLDAYNNGELCAPHRN